MTSLLEWSDHDLEEGGRLANALESLPCAEVERETIEDLRRLAIAHRDS